MRTNDPNYKADPLLESAIRILNDPNRSFDMTLTNTPEKREAFIKAGRRATDPIVPVLNPEGEPEMTKALADQKAIERKQFMNKPGRVKPPKHKPQAPAAREQASDEDNEGVDTPTTPVLQSSFPSINQLMGSTKMTTETKQVGTDGVAKAAQIKADADAVKVAKKAEREAAAAAKKAEKEAAAAAKKAEREAKAAERKAELAAAGSKRTYVGSMLTLADKVKEGVYVKGANGQLS